MAVLGAIALSPDSHLILNYTKANRESSVRSSRPIKSGEMRR